MPVLSNTPTDVTVKVERYQRIPIHEHSEYIMYINGQEYKELPLDANVREPDPAKSKPYKEMLKTLSESPEKFLENNLGISVIASDVQQIKEGVFTLHFKSGTGILNGGHTQLAILNSQKDHGISKAIVRLIVREHDYEDSRIAEIAAAQNSTTSVKAISLAEKKGLFAALKKDLTEEHEKHIVWYEGRKVPNDQGLDANDLISMLNCFNVIRYSSAYSSKDAQPTTSASSNKSVFRVWENDPTSFQLIYPLVDEIIDLDEYISFRFNNGTKMAMLDVIKKNTAGKIQTFSGNKPEYVLPKQFKYPILAAYRANVFYDEKAKKIRWYEDPRQLFDESYKKLFQILKDQYRNYHNINTVGKDKNLYQLLYTSVSDCIKKSKPTITYAIIDKI